jgi:hypothetical protein
MVIRRKNDGTYGTDAQLTASTNPLNERVAGATVVAQQPAQASPKAAVSSSNATSFPAWAWAAIAGVAILVWAGYEVWNRRRARLGLRSCKDDV